MMILSTQKRETISASGQTTLGLGVRKLIGRQQTGRASKENEMTIQEEEEENGEIFKDIA